MTVEITDHEHMVLFLSLIGEANDHMKTQQKKEYIKIFGLAAEIFEESLIPYLQKILTIFCKRVNEYSTDVHQEIAETLGKIVSKLIDKGETYEQ